jgi:RNA polymerase sigma-70 factor (ECF subfamily)
MSIEKEYLECSTEVSRCTTAPLRATRSRAWRAPMRSSDGLTRASPSFSSGSLGDDNEVAGGGKPRTNAEWLSALKSGGDDQVAALTDLRAYLLRGAHFALQRSAGGLAAPHLAQLAEDCAQEAVVAVLTHLDDFRGESRFTTWAYVFAINRALLALRRERWQNVSLDGLLDTPRTFADAAWDKAPQDDPQRRVIQQEIVSTLRKAMDECLTDRQRQALRAIVLESVPLDEVVRHWQSNRNAVYKLLHDARRKLRACLEARGFSSTDVLAVLDDAR